MTTIDDRRREEMPHRARRRALAAWCMAAIVSLTCASACGQGSSSPTTPAGPSGPSAPAPSRTCMSPSPPRIELANGQQRTVVQVVASTPSCSWTATSSPSWITIVRSGPLYQAGNGVLTLDVAGNRGEGAGGCTTVSRTGTVTLQEQATGATVGVQIVQAGSSTPMRPPAACAVTNLPYGVQVAGSINASDCLAVGAPAKYYTFDALPNRRIRLRLVAGRFVSGGLQVPLMRLYGPGGGITSTAGSNVVVDDPEIARNLACGGPYTVETSSRIDSIFNPTGLGAFVLRLDLQN